ncbi:MAG: sugar transferase [Clostridia bacterium]
MNKSNLAVKGDEFELENAIAIEKTNVIDIKIENQEAKKNKIVYKFIKRIIDIIGATIGLIILIPITAIVYIARKALKEDDGPLFYEHLRYGKNGKMFRMYKFRTMCVNADQKLEEYLKENEEARKEFDEYQKLKDDPRITKLGKFLRKTSLDELPQMLNILKGELSFVGPRPVVEKEIERYGKYKEKFLSVKPGLTGYWQVNGRSNTTYEERMKMELYYVDNCSLWTDIKIFLKTFIAVFNKEGAM